MDTVQANELLRAWFERGQRALMDGEFSDFMQDLEDIEVRVSINGGDVLEWTLYRRLGGFMMWWTDEGIESHDFGCFKIQPDALIKTAIDEYVRTLFADRFRGYQ